MNSSGPILQASNLIKRYGATVALDEVSFSLYPGEVCGLLGENGAGKSTLVKILSGIVVPDAGEMMLNRSSYQPRTIIDAKALGLSTAFQELSLVPTLSVAVNLFLPKPKVNALHLVSMRSIEEEAAAVLNEYGISDVSPSTLVADLPLGTRQRIEIIRAMLVKPRVLLLDEATAALSDREWLFGLIAKFIAERASILYVTHRLDEVRRLCERCIILRNGKKVFDASTTGMTEDEVFSQMAGRSVVENYPARESTIDESAPPALAACDLSSTQITGVSFAIRRGEILGVAALEGQGQSNLFKTLVGLAPVKRGHVEVDGKKVALKSPRAARSAGMVLVPEERKSEGLFKDLSTSANVSIPVISRATIFDFIRKGREQKLVEQGAGLVDLHRRFLRPNIDALSGGNQQKAILARSLLSRPKCLLLFDPTRGVDVGTKHNIYRVIRGFARKGGSALFYSTELDELVHLCDRCIVLYRGAIVAELRAEELAPELLLSIAAGHRSQVDRALLADNSANGVSV
jgi:ribose transport system ATP-binding protein